MVSSFLFDIIPFAVYDSKPHAIGRNHVLAVWSTAISYQLHMWYFVTPKQMSGINKNVNSKLYDEIRHPSILDRSFPPFFTKQEKLQGSPEGILWEYWHGFPVRDRFRRNKFSSKSLKAPPSPYKRLLFCIFPPLSVFSLVLLARFQLRLCKWPACIISSSCFCFSRKPRLRETFPHLRLAQVLSEIFKTYGLISNTLQLVHTQSKFFDSF